MIRLYFRQRRRFIYLSAILENRHQQLLSRKISNGHALPGLSRIKDSQGLRLIYLLFLKRYQISQRLSRSVVIKPEHLLDTRICHLNRIFRYFHLRVYHSVHNFSRKLIYAPQRRQIVAGYHFSAHSPNVNSGALSPEIPNYFLIQISWHKYLRIVKAGFIQHRPRLFGKIGKIARIQPYAYRLIALFAQLL